MMKQRPKRGSVKKSAADKKVKKKRFCSYGSKDATLARRVERDGEERQKKQNKKKDNR